MTSRRKVGAVTENFIGSIPKDCNLNCLTSKHALLHHAVIGRMSGALKESTNTSQDMDAIMEMLQFLVRQASSENVTPEQMAQALLQQASYDFQRFDGIGNNLQHPDFAAVQTLLRRASFPDYDPQTGVAVRGASNPNPRVISNSICQGISVASARRLTDMTWAWGQFLDHEIVIVDTADDDPLNITTPSVAEDPSELYPDRTIPFQRSKYKLIDGVREHPNAISGFIDGTNLYGSSGQRAMALRRLDGSGKLKTSLADNFEVLPPYNVDGLPNAAPFGSTPSDFFLLGDVRGNEQALLTAMHTLFIREHNHQCDIVITQTPSLAGSDEQIYQRARRMVIGMMQNITMVEFLPALLGLSVSSTAYAYDGNSNAGLFTEFSTVTYRFGHTMVSSDLALGPSASESVPLRDAFFNPSYLRANGADALLAGATKQLAQEVDGILVEDLRSFLFGPPSALMLHDLAALNIQRGRDHGVPGYNAVRQAFGLPVISSFDALPMSAANRQKLQDLYDNVHDIDPWVGAILEDHVGTSAVGPLIQASLVDQFTRSRSGDRYWFENSPALSAADKSLIKGTTLSDILRRNTKYPPETYATNVFYIS